MRGVIPFASITITDGAGTQALSTTAAREVDRSGVREQVAVWKGKLG